MTGTERTLPDEELAHVTSLAANDIGFFAICTCGWRGSIRDRMSDDYAWTNARDDVKSHERTHQEKRP